MLTEADLVLSRRPASLRAAPLDKRGPYPERPGEGSAPPIHEFQR